MTEPYRKRGRENKLLKEALNTFLKINGVREAEIHRKKMKDGQIKTDSLSHI